eukprot:sb/3469404/
MEVQTCTVPMNFGKENLEFKGINDLQLICSGGEVVRASSFPMIMNSPVMRDLVGCQEIKELDVEEFSHSSVLFFVESCYSGSIILSKEIFREVNKLSTVFKVKWMVKECLKFYTELCTKLIPESLEEAWYLFEEAGYILKERNSRDLQNPLNSSLVELPDLRLALVEDFLARDPNEQEFVYTSLCLSVAGKSTPVLYNWLIATVESKTPPVKLSDVEKKCLAPQPLSVHSG